MTERALVTGATGFIGRHLVERLLASQIEVTCLVRPTSDTRALEQLGVSLAVGDITRPETLDTPCQRVDAVFHLAGRLAAPSLKAFLRVNEGGTRNVAAACARQRKPPRLVVVSSIAAAGPGGCERLRREEDPPSPVSRYGKSKLAAERAAREYASEVGLTIVRPPIVFGPYDREVLRMFRFVDRGWHWVPGRGRRCYSLLHARDLADFLLLAAEQGERVLASGDGAGRGLYFVAHAQHPSYAELGEMIAGALGRRGLRVIRIPMWMTWMVALFLQGWGRVRGEATLLNFDKAREAAAGSWTCSPEKARGGLGFEPRESLSERLRQTAAWYREHSWL